VWGGAYQIVRDGKRAAPLHPRTLAGNEIRRGSNSTEQKAEARMHDALDLALLHVADIQAGHFPARIPKCTTACPTFCD